MYQASPLRRGANSETCSTLTKTNQVPDKGPWQGSEHHVDHPEGVKHFYPHPGQGAEQGVVEHGPHPGAHTVPFYVAQHTG